MIKVLNLYAGIGGNRKLWQNVDVTAVEISSKIANAYSTFFPRDKVIVGDAHNYLLEHYTKFDFIWSSPPCQSHSRIRINCLVGRGAGKPIYADMNLYQEILFLKYHYHGKWVVENVMSYYSPLIKPQLRGKHFFWSNFEITDIQMQSRMHNKSIGLLSKRKGFDLSHIDLGHRKDQILHNCLEPELGKHVFDCAFGNPTNYQSQIFTFSENPEGGGQIKTRN